MNHIDWLAVVVAGLLGYLPGALWYSPLMFLKPWAGELGIDLANPGPAKHGMTGTIIGIVPAIAAAAVFALLAGPAPTLHFALLLSLAVSGGLVATSLAIQYLHEVRSARFYAINAGFHVVQFAIIAAVLALWP
jgi:hypothetical protein